MKAVAGAFTVETENGERIVCSARGKIKRDTDIFVGDYVETEENVILHTYPRKNVLIRPYVANIDLLVIVVASLPEPDWVLVEKLLLNCAKEGIQTAIVCNKCDKQGNMEEALQPYRRDAKVFFVSAKTGQGMEDLIACLTGKTVCFAGQSGVGKTSILSFIGGRELQIGEMSRKIKRGKNTTRQIEIYNFVGGKLVDTCGFSVADSIDIRPEDLIYYYDDFVRVQNQCRFSNCKHMEEPGCKVKEMVERGEFDADRYRRYVKLYQELIERRKKLYG